MKINFAKYLLLFLVLTSCQTQEKQITEYGLLTRDNKSLDVPLKISDFENYGIFIDRILEVTCNDSIPKIVIEENKIIRHIFPLVDCDPPPFNPDEKHYVTFRDGKPYRARSTIEIDSFSLDSKLRDDFSYYLNSNQSDNLESYLVIIEAQPSEKVNGIETFLSNLTQEFDKLKSDLDLNISLWEFVGFIPPPPRLENEEPE